MVYSSFHWEITNPAFRAVRRIFSLRGTSDGDETHAADPAAGLSFCDVYGIIQGVPQYARNHNIGITGATYHGHVLGHNLL